MHETVARVLELRDLSRARDLFAVPNEEIITHVEEITLKLAKIFSHRSYINDTNSQSIAEICIARITSAVR